MDNFSLSTNQTIEIIKEENDALTYILKYASIYIPYTTLSLIVLFGLIKVKLKFEK